MFNYLCPIYTFVMAEKDRKREECGSAGINESRDRQETVGGGEVELWQEFEFFLIVTFSQTVVCFNIQGPTCLQYHIEPPMALSL